MERNVWQRPCAINSCTWHGSGSSSSLSVQACQAASLFSVIIIFLLTATGTESGWFLFFFCFLFLLLFFWVLFLFVAAAAASFGSGFLAEITTDPSERESYKHRQTTVMRVRCLANTYDKDESSLYAIFHLCLGICRKLFSELPRRRRRRRRRPRPRPMFMFTSTGGHRK